MSDSISATCVCGAEFGAISDRATQLWREWKRDHACKLLSSDSVTLGSDHEIGEEDEAEFSIGFQYEPDE